MPDFTVIFPQEIVDRIIDGLYGDEHSLRACSLVCRALFSRSRGNLFVSISLDEFKDDLRSRHKDLYSLFGHLLELSPHLGQAVKHVYLLTNGWGSYDLLKKLLSLSYVSLLGVDDVYRIPTVSGEIESLTQIANRPSFLGFNATISGHLNMDVLSLPKLRDLTLLDPFIDPSRMDSRPQLQQRLDPLNELNMYLTLRRNSPSPLRSLRVEVLLTDNIGLGEFTAKRWLNLDKLQMFSYEAAESLKKEKIYAWVSEYLVPSYSSLQVLVICPRQLVVQEMMLHPGLALSLLPNLKSLRISFVYRRQRQTPVSERLSELISDNRWFIQFFETSSRAASWLGQLLATASPTTTLDELRICIQPYNLEAFETFEKLLDWAGYRAIRQVTLVVYNIPLQSSAEKIRATMKKLPEQTDLVVKTVGQSGVEREIWDGFCDYPYL